MQRVLKLLTAVQLFFVSLSGVFFALDLWAITPGAASLLQFEQKYVNRTLDTNKIMALQNYQSVEYSPEKAQVFEVNSYWIPKKLMHVFEVKNLSTSVHFQMMRTVRNEEQVLFLVHPESESFFSSLTENSEKGPRFFGTATASSRTLLMWPEENPADIFFGKLSLNKEIGGVVRTIPQGEIARSIGTTKILESAKYELPSNFDFLPEFFGVIPKGWDRGGMILRSLPEKYQTGHNILMPLFALYTRPDFQSPSPIQQMIARSGMSADQFVQKHILRPFAKQWVELVTQHGIAVEAHAQNVLMEVNPRGMPTGKLVYRDFGGFNIDLNFRRNQYLSVPFELPVIKSEEKDYHQRSHTSAIRQSLQNYYEGGFLFGLGQELERLGYSSLSYEKLISLLHQQIADQFKVKGISLKLRSFLFLKTDFFENLLESVNKARAQKVLQRPMCQRILISAK